VSDEDAPPADEAAGAADAAGAAELALADPDISLDSFPEGRALKAQFIANFGTWFDGEVRPLLRRVHQAGGEPQLLVNDIAGLLQNIAEFIVFPADDEDDEDEDDDSGVAAES
jgi:hypothetical protein